MSSARTVLLAFLLAAFLPQQAAVPTPQPAQTPVPPPVVVPFDLFHLPEGLEITLLASTPMLRNPTAIDILKDGRIWGRRTAATTIAGQVYVCDPSTSVVRGRLRP